MAQDTLEHLLRRATRNFHSGLPEAQTLDLGRQLCRELERAHAELPPRHPSLDPADIATENGTVRLEGGSTQGDVAFDLFQVGCLLTGLAQGREPDVSWRLDGPPQLEASTAAGSSAIRGLATFQTESRFLSAAAAAEAFEAALAPSVDPPVIWPAESDLALGPRPRPPCVSNPSGTSASERLSPRPSSAARHAGP
jgi:hypothetical protein